MLKSIHTAGIWIPKYLQDSIQASQAYKQSADSQANEGALV